MHYPIIFASLAAVAITVPVGMKDMKNSNTIQDVKQADDIISYGAYGEYSKYASYQDYPDGVEEAAKMMTKANVKRDMMTANKANEMMNDATIANMMRKETMMTEEAAASNMKRKEMMMNAKQAKDRSDMGQADNVKRDTTMKDATTMMDAKQAEDESYGKYGKYPGDVEEEAAKMEMA